MTPTVLLLHAFPLDARMWDGHREAIEAEGWPVVAPDLPPGAESSFGEWAGHTLSLVDGPFVPVGVSMGGYQIFELWRRAPGRIRALALVDTRATAESEEAKAGRAELIEAVRAAGGAAAWERMGPRLLSPYADPAAVARAREIALSRPPEKLVATVEAIRDRADSLGTLATISAPALVVVGEEDVITPPAEAEQMAAAIPDARLVRLSGCGHLPPLEKPAELRAALLGFLRETAA